MNNLELKEKIKEYVLDEEILDKIVVLEGDEYADGVIGITEDYRLVYSYEKLVESLMKTYDSEDESIKWLEAVEWLNYNTLRSIPYMESQGLLAPVIIHDIV